DVSDDASIMLGKIYYKQKDYEQAYSTYMSLVETDVFSPNEADALLGASMSLYSLGRIDESIALSARALKIPGLSDPQKLEIYRHRYNVLSTTNDRLETLRTLSYLHQMDPRPEARTHSYARAQEIVGSLLDVGGLKKVVSGP